MLDDNSVLGAISNLCILCHSDFIDICLNSFNKWKGKASTWVEKGGINVDYIKMGRNMQIVKLCSESLPILLELLKGHIFRV